MDAESRKRNLKTTQKAAKKRSVAHVAAEGIVTVLTEGGQLGRDRMFTSVV